jgi:trimeric autotransporter adhesin
MNHSIRFSLAALGLFALAPAANAELIYGITDNSTGAGVNLISFDSATPGTITTIGPLTGAVGNQLVRGIDFRPANGQLYAVSNLGTSAQLYTVNTGTGALTPVGSGFTFASNPGTRISIDFNPVVDRLRIVSANTNNIRVNPNNGALAGTDTNLSYDPTLQINGTPFVVGAAYDNNVSGATQTTLYDFDFNFDVILTQGGINGSPSPNGGVLFDSLNTPGQNFITNSGSLGFDISGSTGIGYINADRFQPAPATLNDTLFTVNLSNGVLSPVGDFGINVLDISAYIAPVPEPGSIALLMGLGMAGGLALRRRKR